MEPNEKENQLQDEVVTVELGKETEIKTVEQEIADETPTEAPDGDVTVEEEKVKAPSETDTSISSTEEKLIEKEGKIEEKSDDTPSKEKEEEKKAEEPSETPTEEPSEEPSEEPDDEPSAEPEESGENREVNPSEELAKTQRELAEYKEAEEKRAMVNDIQAKAVKAVNDFDNFSEKLSMALEDTFKQYDIDTTKTLDELKEQDPAKYSIACDLIGHAEAIRNQKIREFQAPVIEAQKALVFREASKIMCDYDLTDEQAKETAKTFVDIINQVGVADIDEDLKAKVELAVARAKMIKPAVMEEKKIEAKEKNKDVQKEDELKVEETKEEDKKEDVKAETKEAADTATEEIKEEPKVSLDAFTEGASSGDIISNAGDEVTAENVLQKLAELPYRNRGAFYQKYNKLISQVGIQRYKQQGLR